MIGQLLKGYCGGYFGRDSYDDKRIEAIGVDWIVARAIKDDAKPEFAQFENHLQKEQFLKEFDQ